MQIVACFEKQTFKKETILDKKRIAKIENNADSRRRAVVSGGAGGALAPPEFGGSVNPIPTGGGRLCPLHYC